MTRTNTSASNFFRRVGCPGSAIAEDGFSEAAVSPYASQGSWIHYQDSIDAEGDTLTEQEFLARNRMLRDEFMAIQRKEHKIAEDEPMLTFKENLECWVHDGSGRLPISGHPDLILYFPRKKLLYVFDTKSGRKPVSPAESNYQIRIYLLGLCDPDFGDYEVVQCYGAITAPYCRPSIHSVCYTPDDLRLARAEVIDAWKNTQLPDAPRRPSIDSCLHCRASASCAPAIGFMKGLAAIKISELPIQELEAMVPRIEFIQNIINAFWARMESIATDHPTLLAEHEMKPGASIEGVSPVNVESAFALLTVNGLITREEFDSCRKLSVAQIREIVGKNQGLSKKDAKTKVSEVLAPVLEISQNKPSLVEKKRVLMLETK